MGVKRWRHCPLHEGAEPAPGVKPGREGGVHEDFAGCNGWACVRPKNVGGLAKVLLAIDSPEAQIAADELEEGGSRKSATEKVNEYRLTRGLEHVGRG